MNFLKLMSLIGTGIIDIIRVVFTNKSETKRIKATSRSYAQEKKQAHEIDWDMMQAYSARKSWKDEFWTILLATPMIMCFIPGLEAYAVKGFKNLEDVPEWYMISLGVAIASAFGFRRMVEFMVRRK